MCRYVGMCVCVCVCVFSFVCSCTLAYHPRYVLAEGKVFNKRTLRGSDPIRPWNAGNVYSREGERKRERKRERERERERDKEREKDVRTQHHSFFVSLFP